MDDFRRALARSHSIASRLAAGPGATVLSLGCGSGFELLILGKAVGSKGRVIGLDADEVAVRHARGRATAAGLGHVSVLVGDVHNPPISLDRVDTIYCGFLLHLVDWKPELLTQLARLNESRESRQLVTLDWEQRGREYPSDVMVAAGWELRDEARVGIEHPKSEAIGIRLFVSGTRLVRSA